MAPEEASTQRPVARARVSRSPQAFKAAAQPAVHVLAEYELSALSAVGWHTAQSFGPVSIVALVVVHPIVAIHVSSFQELTDVGGSTSRLAAFSIVWKPR